ncbi:hypothetical protein X975_16482, partial [Stegodyphus mimosarum]
MQQLRPSGCRVSCLLGDDIMCEIVNTNSLRSAYYRPDFLAFILVG